MASKTTYAENLTLEYLLRSSARWIALYTTIPDDEGANGVEVSGGAYARLPITFDAPVNGRCVNSDDLVWEIPTTDWGTVAAFGIFDAETDGNLLYPGTLAPPTTLVTGSSRFTIPAGNVEILED